MYAPGHTSHSLCLALFVLASLGLAACRVEPEAPTLRFDLTVCLGDPVPDAGMSDGQIPDAGPSVGAAAARCRAPLVQANACFVATAADGAIERRDIRWQGGGVAFEGQTAFNSGQVVTSAMFFGLACDDDILPPTACDPDAGCLLKLGPVEQQAALEGETVVDFTIAGACAREMGALANDGASEVCNGFDDDCDGEIDEAIRVGEMCMLDGVGRCNAFGDRLVCKAGRRACGDEDGPVIAPLPLGADADCNGVDDDCDRRVDEDMDCTACQDDSDCNQPGLLLCVDEFCRACDPGQQRGCPLELPICDANTATCRLCTTDDECYGGEVCTAFSGCTACDPTRPETCPNPALPVCDGATFTCRPCRDDLMGECPQGFCSGGRCGGCDPNAPDGGGCANPSPICDIRDVDCRGCTNDNECSESHPDAPICRNNNCQACEVGSNAGCFEIDKPVCALVEGAPTCVPCYAEWPCLVGTCTDGQCVGCDPETNAGCLLDSPRPYCDPGAGGGPENAFCRECRVDAECPGERICREEGRCVFCVNATGEGCDEQGAEPVCGNGACRACRNDGECLARDGERDECVDGGCALCDPVDNAGCDDPAQPACRAGRCQPCINDGECLEALAGQCINATGRCAACDPNGNDGCRPEAPICDRGDLTCRQCNDDDECGPGAICNGAGRCETCDPNTRDDEDPLVARGCDEASPICTGMPGAFACRGCQRDDQCSGGQCLADGRCKPCDPDDYAGCERDPRAPVCDDVTFTCRRCGGDGDCGINDLAAVCDIGDGACVTCTRRGDTYPGCDPDSDLPVCGTNGGRPACLPCQNNTQCIMDGTPYCVAGGRCAECTRGPQGILNTGCDPTGNEPVCEPGVNVCTGCVQSAECQSIDPNRPLCDDEEGRCVECKANIDCGGETPRCQDGVCVGCGDDAFCRGLSPARGQCLDDGRCAECDPDTFDGCGGIRPICNRNTLACQACTPGDCLFGNCTPEGCTLCDPGEPTDCVLDPNNPGAAGPPVCQPVTFKCVECQDNDDCVNHPYGPFCVDGRCACNAEGARCDLSSRRPICNGAGMCETCGNDDECFGNPYGATCDVSGGDRGNCE